MSGLVCKKHSSIQSKHSNCTNAINVSITRSSDSSGRRGDSAGGSAVIIIACFTSVVPTFLVAYNLFLHHLEYFLLANSYVFLLFYVLILVYQDLSQEALMFCPCLFKD